MWMIPLLDNISGLGKSQFAQEYIRTCRRQWDALPASDKDGDFLNIIRQSHTITVKLSPTDLLHEDMSFDMEKARGSFVMSIRAFIEEKYGTIPRALDLIEANPDHVDILMQLAIEVGPLFIVIDDIASAFDASTLDALAKEDRFMEFCKKVLRPLFFVKHLFFLIAGRAPFLDYLASSGRYFTFRRLSLRLLRPPAIQEIVKKTYWDKKQVKTVQEHYIINDGQVKEIADHLLKTTLGRPRSLLGAFRTCHSYNDLAKYEMSGELGENVNWQHLGECLRRYEAPLQQLLDSAENEAKNLVDLSYVWKEDGGELVSYAVIADMFGIVWDGNLYEAKLFPPPYIQHVMSYVYPTRKLLEKLTILDSHGLSSA